MSEHVRDLSGAALNNELLHSKEPILIDFWAPWCVPCRAMSPVLEAAARKLAGAVKVYKVNVDDYPSVATRFNVLGIPTMILFKDGQETNRLVGVSSAERIES